MLEFNVKEAVENKVNAFVNADGDFYLLAYSNGKNTVEVKEIAPEIFKTLDFIHRETKTMHRITFKATAANLKKIANCEIVATFDRKKLDEMLENGKKENSGFNCGHVIEMALFGTTVDQIMASKTEIDGIYHGKKVQVKASLTQWNEKTGRNNSKSTASFVDIVK